MNNTVVLSQPNHCWLCGDPSSEECSHWVQWAGEDAACLPVPRHMLVVGGRVACGLQTRVVQATRLCGGWRGFGCSYCGLLGGRTGGTSVLLQLSLDVFLVHPQALALAAWCRQCDAFSTPRSCTGCRPWWWRPPVREAGIRHWESWRGKKVS